MDYEIFQEPIDLTPGPRPGRPSKWPFRTLKVGEGFYVTDKVDRIRVKAAIYNWNWRLKDEGKRFICKPVAIGLRIQRVR
jgi:hypothetical protein